MQPVFTAAEMRALDARAIETLGIPGPRLMENAGRGAAAVIAREWAPVRGRRILVLCGKGNNGGDGFVVARHLKAKGARPRVLLVGLRAEVTGDTLTMALGYSHPVVFKLPKGISAKVEKNRIALTGADRDMLGQTAAKVRELRPPEPYKGKGVKYVEETIKRKVGKAGATSGGS